MTKLWAVSHIDWYNNNLITEFHLGETWKEALAKHSVYNKERSKEYEEEWIAGLPFDIESAKEKAFDCDSMIEVVEVPLYTYMQETVAGFIMDPADNEYQRGFLEAIKVCLAEGVKPKVPITKK